jgi:hypothetical protein
MANSQKSNYIVHSKTLCQSTIVLKLDVLSRGLRTPNEGINQRYLKNWADVADKIPKIFGLGLNFRPYSEDYFLSGYP